MLRKHELEMQESVYNPFNTNVKSHDYLSVAFQLYKNYGNSKGAEYFHYITLDSNLHVEKRIRYSLWAALSDVGGFHDGLKLVLDLFMAPMAATFFENELLRGKLFSLSLSKS